MGLRRERLCAEPWRWSTHSCDLGLVALADTVKGAEPGALTPRSAEEIWGRGPNDTAQPPGQAGSWPIRLGGHR